ncbi:murein hydrolase activator EnvC family protein [Reinekea sp.]|uniref:murein hydrolase activator EnvC family protein n=1 Tax=Reinekea sp. TaxID=1970455 RepID=UPI002A7F7DB7|nr:peptidoglycan DD-metalloendopeptidase family protein [Reinekea sp.]
MFRSFILALWLVVLLVGGPLQADDLAKNQAGLQAVNKELKALQATLAVQQKDVSSARQALQRVERDMAQVQQKTAALNQAVISQESAIARLRVQKNQLQANLAEQKDEIAAVLRLAYKQNNQPLIKLLLSDERPEDLARHLYYFSVLTANQQQQVQRWVTEQNDLAANLRTEAQLLSEMQENKERLAEQSRKLSRQKNKRTLAIAAINLEAENTTDAIGRKEQERVRMTDLIAQLEVKLASMNLAFPDAEATTNIKGELPWPVAGRLTNAYGRSIDGSVLSWQGWLIAAPLGSDVLAVQRGRVVFADFFKSNGLLVIIDHGAGIWTLYGRNQALLRDVGSWVEAGDVIAEVGQSGGYNQSGLYFEVRKNGEPENPANWLQKR